MQGSLRALIGVLACLLAVPVLGLATSSADAASSFHLLASTSASRTAPGALQGDFVSGAAYIFVSPTFHVTRVSFWVDDTHRLKTPRRTDTSAPFDLVSGTAAKAKPWWTSGLREGAHHLTAQVTTTGGAHIVLQTVFTVRNTPKAPTTPRTVAGNGEVTVIWHSSHGTTTGFNVYRGTKSPVARIKPLNGKAPLAASRTSFLDTTAVNSTRYFYVVAAVSAHGLLSKPSPTVSARPLAAAPAAPPAPESVVATSGSGQITVGWSSGGGSTSGFNVYRSTTSSNVSLTNPLNGSTPLGAGASSYADPVSTSGKYYYVVQAVSGSGARSDPSSVAVATFGAAGIQLSSPKPVLYTQKGSGTVTGTVRVTNVGDAMLTVTGEQLLADSPYASSYLSLTPVTDFSLAGGQHQDLTFSFTPVNHGPQHAIVRVTSDDPDNATTTLGIGGVAVDNLATSEPSLQWIIDAYGIDANDGDPKPYSYQLDATTIPPPGGILVRGFTRRVSTQPIRVTALGAFVNPATAGDATKDPSWGWTPQNTSPGSATASYAVRRDFIGTTYTIIPSGRFGLWTKVENLTQSTDQNPSTAPRFIAFPVNGSPGTYVIANDTTGRTSDDWNDLPLLIENVDTVPPAS